MKATLYVVPASHPCYTVEAALALKGLDFDRRMLPPGVSALVQRVRFGKRTVPGLILDGERFVGSRLICRTLEERVPAPSLYPDDPGARRAHDEAELWGDEVLQEAARWILLSALLARPDAAGSYSEGTGLPPVPGFLFKGGVKLEMRLLHRSEDYVRGEIQALGDHLDRVDGYIDSGLLGNGTPTAAGLQIGSSLRLLMTVEDIAPLIEGRPAGDLARRLFPEYPGNVPAGTLSV